MVSYMIRKFPIIIFLSMIILALPQSVKALDAPDITFIPSQISINSSFLVIADPNAGDEDSIRVNWFVGGLTYGSFPKISGKWMCYFSSTDASSTCGPTPFTEPGSYTFVASSVDQNGETSNQTDGETQITVGNLRLSVLISKTGNEIKMEVYPSDIVSGVSYKVYSSTGDMMSGLSGNLVKEQVPYVGTVSLANGEYYIAFEADALSGGDFGGAVSRVFVGATSTGDKYQLSVDDIVWRPILQKGASRTKSNNEITNIGTSSVGSLSVSIPSELRPYIDIGLDKAFLNVSESMYYTLTLTNIQSSLEINTAVDILSGTTKVGEIILDVRASVINETGSDITCEEKNDGTYCIGGICCSEICREKSTCCSSLDCGSNEVCTNYICRQETSTDECSGQIDGYSCTGGICCDEKCSLGGECCSDFDCGIDETCSSNTCVSSSSECVGSPDGVSCASGRCFDEECVECYIDSHCSTGEICNLDFFTCSTGVQPTGEVDYTLIIIAAVAAAGGIGAFVFLKKFRKGGGKGEEEEYKEDEKFSDEEFY